MKKIFISIPFIVGVFLIIYAGFGVVYFQKQAEYQELQLRIAPNRTILQKPHPDLEKLEKQLSQVEAELEEQWTFLPIPEEAIELCDALVNVAQLSDVEVVSVAAAPPIEKETEVASYTVFLFDITVQGSQDAILTFISNLAVESELLQGLEVESISISSSTSPDTSDISYTANLQLIIPTQPNFAM